MWTNQSKGVNSFNFPSLQTQSGGSWDRQTPKERLATAANESKDLLRQRRDVETESKRILELLKQEHNELSLISNFINSSGMKSLENFLSLVSQKDKEGTFVNHVNSKDGSTALLLSIQKTKGGSNSTSKDDELIKILLKFPSIDVNKESKKGTTPLSYSIQQDEFSKFQLLLVRRDIDVNKLSSGVKPVITASELGERYHKFTFELLAHGALLKQGEFEQVFTKGFLEYKNSNGKTPMGIMISQGKLEEIKYLVKQGVDIIPIT